MFDERTADDDPLVTFMQLFDAESDARPVRERSTLSVEERLKNRIVDGERKGVEADLEEALTRYEPLEIINTILLDGMKEVGELFASGEMQLPSSPIGRDDEGSRGTPGAEDGPVGGRPRHAGDRHREGRCPRHR